MIQSTLLLSLAVVPSIIMPVVVIGHTPDGGLLV